MPGERTHDVMSATGGDHVLAGKLSQVYEGDKTLLQSLRLNDSILIIGNSGRWHVSRGLLTDASVFFERMLHGSTQGETRVGFIQEAPFELFLQWLYTRQYHEHRGYALIVENDHYNLDVEAQPSLDHMVWCAKAACLACDLGRRLEAVAFQNYAMKRLFRAYTVTSPRATVTPTMLEMCEPSDELQLFLEDLIIRNWGNTSIIDHTDSEWPTQLKNNERFRETFVIGMGEDRAQRQKPPMQLEGYLIQEDD